MIKSIIQYSPTIIVPTIINIIIVFIYGKYLSPEIYGEINIFMTTVSLLNAVFFTFIAAALLRLYLKFTKEYEESIVFSSYLIMILIVSLILIFMSSLIGGSWTICIAIATIGLGIFNFISNYFRIKEYVFKLNLLKILPPVLNLIILLIVIIFLKSENTMLMIFAVYFPFTFITCIFLVRKFHSIRFNNIDFKIIKKSSSYGFGVAIVGILSLSLYATDIYMVEYFLTDYEVGNYSFGYKISELIMVQLAMIMMMALYPKLIKIYDEEGRLATEKVLNKYLKLHYILTFPIVTISILFISPIFALLFPNYIGSIEIIYYVIIGTFFLGLSFYTNKVFELSGNMVLMSKILVVTVVVNAILNFVFMNYYGLKGIAISTIITYMFYVFFSIKMSKKILVVKLEFSFQLKIILLNLFLYKIIDFIQKKIFDISLLQIVISITLYLAVYIFILYLYGKFWRRVTR